jgi:hypothetical protein
MGAHLATVCILQYVLELSDRHAAEAVRCRIDFTYALGLELEDPGFHHSVLSDFRTRLAGGDRAGRLGRRGGGDPRVTWDQGNYGSRVSREELQPGDLVFFYEDISYVGLSVGDGMMIHAPNPSTVVKYESMDVMPIYGYVRPA